LAWLRDLDPIAQALIAGGFTWLLTAVGATAVFFTRRLPERLLDAMLGFAAGVMIAASCWSLLVPSIDMAAAYAFAFAAGAMIFVVVEELIPEAQQGGRTDLATGATMVGFAVMMVLDVALS
jgi:ZIP family zinc transporter